MAIVKISIRKERKDKHGLCPLMITVQASGTRVRCNTTPKVPVDFWDDAAKEVKKGYPDASVINSTITNKLALVRSQLVLLENQKVEITERIVKGILDDRPENENFLKYAKLVMDEIDNEGTHRRYTVELNAITEYAKGPLSFADITPVFLTKYKTHLLKDKEENTVINAFKFIRKVFNQAKDNGVTTLYPFTDWKLPVYKEPIKDYLTLDECDGLLKLFNENDLDETFSIVLSYFLLECFSGIRFSDWGRFEVEKIIHEEGLFIRATKKTDQPIYIPLSNSPRLKRIVDFISQNNFKYTYTLEHTNRILKLLGAMAKIKTKLTTHVGRHTCATLLLEKGFSKETVAEVLGVSMKIVDTYAKMTRQKVKNEYSRIGGL
jgi:site-specific recombinase XerD